MSEKPSLGGARKKNGHKLNCVCHICENMKKKAQRGGYEEEAKRKAERKRGGPQKKNGHKTDCNCPICKNMRNAKRRGGDGEQHDGDGEGVETPATDKEHENLNDVSSAFENTGSATGNPDEPLSGNPDNDTTTSTGGTRRRYRKKRSTRRRRSRRRSRKN